MTHVLFISPYYLPEKGAAAVCVSETAKSLVKRGYQVTILTTVPNYPNGVVPPEYRGHLLLQEMLDGVRVVRVWSYVSPTTDFLRRLVAQLSFAFLAPLLGGRAIGQPDIIIVQSPPLFDAIPGHILATWKHCPFIFMVSDLWPETAIQLGVLRNRALIRIAEWLEWSSYQKAGLVWAVSESLRDLLIRRGLSPEHVFLLTNGVNTTTFRPLQQAQARRELGWNDRFTLLFAGNHGLVYSLETVLEAAEQLQSDTGIHFVLVGDGVKKGELMAYVQRCGLKNVTFLDPVPNDQVPRLLAAADACVIPLRKLPLLEMALPVKMLEAMACARPIVLAIDGESRRLTEEAGAAICVEPEHTAALVNAIHSLREHPDLARSMGQRGRTLVEARFDYDQLTAMLDTHIAALLGQDDHKHRPMDLHLMPALEVRYDSDFISNKAHFKE